MVNDNALLIWERDFSDGWRMELNLDKIVEDAGTVKKTSYYDPDTKKTTYHREVLLPLPQCRRIINMILECAEPEDLDEVGEFFRKNDKLWMIWNQKREQVGK